MPGKPNQSKLIPYREEIAALRRMVPPKTYVQIAKILNERHPGLNVSHNAVWSFVKVRAQGRSRVVYVLPEHQPPATPEPDSCKADPALTSPPLPTERPAGSFLARLKQKTETDPYQIQP